MRLGAHSGEARIPAGWERPAPFAPRVELDSLIWSNEKFTQLVKRLCAPFIRDVMARFRNDEIKASQGAAELGLSTRRFYKLYSSYLQAVGQRRTAHWIPGTSGGNRRKPWRKDVQTKALQLLEHGCGYSAVASELLRRFGFKTHRATVRRFALDQGLASQRPQVKTKPIRRWQTQRVGQLWQYDASPHRWFAGQQYQPTLLHMLDDHSRVIVGARLYERETLLAHLDFASLVFQTYGLPLCLYVDYHSFFFTHTPEAHTQFAACLRFYGVSLRFAPTPQAKGKIERGHQFWQHRLPALFAAEHITDLAEANPLLDQLRKHHNQMEKHREIGSTPQQAWDLAHKENRWALRPAPRCPWWPYIFTQRTRVTVGSDGKIAVGSQRLPLEVSPGSKVVRCQHPNGDVTVLKHPPQENISPVVLLSTRLC